MENLKQTEVDTYCPECEAYICNESVTFEETCDKCGTQIEYLEEDAKWIIEQIKQQDGKANI